MDGWSAAAAGRKQTGGEMKQPWLRVSILILAAVLLPPASTFAQSVGSIAGTVMDTSKGALPGAVVTARNEGTSAVREVVTDAQGRYAMPLLPIGSYTVTATMSGFQGQERSQVVLEVQASLTLDFALNIAGLTSEVTVTGRLTRCSCSAATHRWAS